MIFFLVSSVMLTSSSTIIGMAHPKVFLIGWVERVIDDVAHIHVYDKRTKGDKEERLDLSALPEDARNKLKTGVYFVLGVDRHGALIVDTDTRRWRHFFLSYLRRHMKERCIRCSRLLPIGQLRKVDNHFVCIKEAACEKAKNRKSAEQTPVPKEGLEPS